MYGESGYYPPGAEFDPRAPWNQVDPPEENFNVTVSQSLSRKAVVCTDNYIPIEDEEEWYPDTSDTNWNEEYKNGHYTPLDLIKILKEVLQSNLENGIVYKKPYITEQIIRDCEGWIEDDYEVVED